MDLPNMASCFIKASQGESLSRTEFTVLNNTIMEVTSHHVFYFPLVRSKSQVLPILPGRELHRRWESGLGGGAGASSGVGGCGWGSGNLLETVCHTSWHFSSAEVSTTGVLPKFRWCQIELKTPLNPSYIYSSSKYLLNIYLFNSTGLDIGYTI